MMMDGAFSLSMHLMHSTVTVDQLYGTLVFYGPIVPYFYLIVIEAGLPLLLQTQLRFCIVRKE